MSVSTGNSSTSAYAADSDSSGTVTVTNSGSTFTITRTWSVASQTLYYRTVDESALAGTHYTAVSGTLSGGTQTVTVTEASASTDSVDFYQNSNRKYRLEVYDSDGSVLSGAERTISYGDTYKVSDAYYSSEYSIYNFGGSTTSFKVTDDGYYNNDVHNVSLSEFFTAAGNKTYFSETGTALYTRLTFEAYEKDDGYQYVQILADNADSCDSGAKDGNPGTIDKSLYMAGFSIAGKGVSTSYDYAFPVTNAANDCSKITDAWGNDSYYNLDNPAGDLVKQKFKADSNRSSDGTYLIVPITTSTLNYRFNASGSKSDDWVVKYPVVKLTLRDTTAPTITGFSAPGGTYRYGDYVRVAVKFSEIVNTSGTPTVTTDCGTFSCIGGSGTNVLYFGGYLTATAAKTSITLSGISGTIEDMAGNAYSGTPSKSDLFTVAATTLSGSPCTITTRAQLLLFADTVNGGSTSLSAKLGADITVNPGTLSSSGGYTAVNGEPARVWTPIGSSGSPYIGTFDGGGHTISGLYMTSGYYRGLFGSVGTGGTVKNLTVGGSCIYGNAKYIGGVCGLLSGGTITDCKTTDDYYIRGYSYVGGFVGQIAEGAAITGCTNSAAVYGDISETGGIVGENHGTVSKCENNGQVDKVGYCSYMGGIAGYNTGTVSDCKNTAAVVGYEYYGGIAGVNRGTLKSCLNTSSSTGGGVYDTNSGTAEYCFYLAGASTDNSDGTFARTEDDFKDGEATYMLNNGETDGKQAWYQLIGTNTYPILGSQDSGASDTVYDTFDENGASHGYTNDGTNISHKYDANGFCNTTTGCTSYYEPAFERTDDSDNTIYEIANAGQLFWFAAKVTGDGSKNTAITSASPSISGELVSDIDLRGYAWTPIGTTSNPYKGSFIGNGHTVTLAISSTSSYQGLFGTVGGGVTIDGVITAGSVTSSGNYIAGLVGGSSGSGAVTITRCGNEATVSGGANAAGIFGCNVGSSATVTIENCYNTGSVTGTKESAAISGGLGTSAAVTNCYNTAAVTGCDSGKPFARYSSATFTNCYQLSTITEQSGITSKEESAFTSGEAAYLLQGSETDTVWGQEITSDTKDKYPVLTKDTSKRVRKVTFKNGNAEFATAYTNDGKTAAMPTTDPTTASGMPFIGWTTSDGDAFDETTVVTEDITVTANFHTAEGSGTEDAPYIIKVLDDLKYFAHEVNSGSKTACARLDADIAVNPGICNADGTYIPLDSESVYHWTPIGSVNAPYTGTFDGNSYKITGLYISSESDDRGLFGYIRDGGTVKNLTVENSYIDGGNFVGAICGCLYNGGTITGCTNSGVVSGNGSFVGGIAGYSSAAITDCINTGSISGNDSFVGGITGDSRGTVTDCANLGTVSGESSVGGIVGYVVSNSVLKSSMNTGTATGTGEYVGKVYGRSNGGTITNCYYQADTTSNNTDGTYARTSDQFASGEVAYGLNGGVTDGTQAWYQTLLSDTCPVLDATHKTVYRHGSETYTYSNIPFNGTGAESDPYRINNVAELQELAATVNKGESYAGLYLILENDLNLSDVCDDTRGISWTPIGSSTETPFAGTFDGNRHTVSGLYINGSDNTSSLGLFGVTSGTIKNLETEGTVTGGLCAGGIAGSNSGTIEYCAGRVTVSGGSCLGGIAGDNSNGTVKCCYTTVDGIGTNGTFENCYYLYDTLADKNNGTYSRTEDEFTSGQVTYELNSGITDGTQAWYQTLTGDDPDSYPTLAATHETVYKHYDEEDEETTYSNVRFDGAGTEGDPYLIKTVADLQNLAINVNDGTNYKGNYFRLENNLDLSDVCGDTLGISWTPIGCTVPTKDNDTGIHYPFSGTFDGNNHTISGLYIDGGSDDQGLFGLNCGTIKNLTVNGTVTAEGYRIGIVCGYMESGTITNCTALGSVTGDGEVGGVCGNSNLEATISNCCSAAAVDGTSDVGGVCGYVDDSTTITNCYYQADTETDSIDGTTAKTATQFASGEVAHALQSGQTDMTTQVWGQDITSVTKDAVPILTTETAKKVLKVTFTVGDTTADSAFVNYNKALGTALPTAPTGYVWYVTGDTANTKFTADTAVTADTTVTALSTLPEPVTETTGGSTVNQYGGPAASWWKIKLGGVKVDDSDAASIQGFKAEVTLNDENATKASATSDDTTITGKSDIDVYVIVDRAATEISTVTVSVY